ncbi:unnamed protein product [Taenia asiatica]|uniref:Late endosomal/lysosomal adaptor and MAPK and MTOR activator 5 n=1 Tax=Taenia asiatica TaxID=60517 RepID=A0A0R3VYN1_TAEAS|nr:unnamed protein product [Taenia asiatica]
MCLRVASRLMPGGASPLTATLSHSNEFLTASLSIICADGTHVGVCSCSTDTLAAGSKPSHCVQFRPCKGVGVRVCLHISSLPF